MSSRRSAAPLTLIAPRRLWSSEAGAVAPRRTPPNCSSSSNAVPGKRISEFRSTSAGNELHQGMNRGDENAIAVIWYDTGSREFTPVNGGTESK